MRCFSAQSDFDSFLSFLIPYEIGEKKKNDNEAEILANE